ncbi:type IVB secretion system protein IcmH/DotU [Janthinobacterium agaricidamnosum]|uniref:Type VI secretion system OmpA/MotB family protein n=1 Tax=Janthinobacterium agaricidamnosum NBRC 102515 = DSM 9628 TaxID=1349767 RepID=W0VF55_9BURK|nr:type IVB secretion system protein IcmH/DotU [Janthinobacterium agaricidamnosum]CDG85972.1 type VI secretion system OmpA/MotB family protein [Janthinobacterium agaricidamnosum NBRC 102515 = DSM 9628]
MTEPSHPFQDQEQDPDRTILVPSPAGRRPPASAAPAAANLNPVDPGPVQLHGSGLNPLVRAANPLLDLIVPLRLTVTQPDLEQLRERLQRAIHAFEAEARAARIDTLAIAAARYALCTLLDETVSSTPWGGSVWGSRSLLVTFHNEAWGGEKFFLVLQRLSQDARANLDLLELMYLCLSLGLQGRYRVLEGGHEQLALLRERLQYLIAQQRGTYEPDLSPHWRGAASAPRSMLRLVPLWVLAAAAGVILLVLHLVLSIGLNRASDPVYAALLRIHAAPAALPARAAIARPAPDRLARFLAPEIAAGLVSVDETADRSIVTLKGDGLFASGSAEPDSHFDALLLRIGDALVPMPGKVSVIGHTDNTRPGLSARFPSNFDLSKARAAAVLRMLAQRAGPAGRYTAEGRGDGEPLAPNDTALGRARNRRVDIVLLTPPAPQ